MQICLNLREFFHYCSAYIYQSIDLLNQKVKAVWGQVQLAYNESSKQIPKLLIPKHPVLNTYPQEAKRKNWPTYLDNAWGKWGNPNNLEGIANYVEPLEKVTALHAATLGKNISGIYRLIANGANVNAEDIRGQTPAYWAAYHGNLQALMALKIYGADLNRKDFRDKTLLRAATKYGHEDVISFLATQKVNLNALDGRGLTALHLAAYKGRFSVYEKLVMYGADRTLKDSLGRTADEILKMKCAEIYNNHSFLYRLFTSPNPPTPLLKPWNVENLREKISKNPVVA